MTRGDRQTSACLRNYANNAECGAAFFVANFTFLNPEQTGMRQFGFATLTIHQHQLTVGFFPPHQVTLLLQGESPCARSKSTSGT